MNWKPDTKQDLINRLNQALEKTHKKKWIYAKDKIDFTKLDRETIYLMIDDIRGEKHFPAYKLKELIK